MKKVIFVLIAFLFAACADTSLKPEEAQIIIKERLAKMPGRSVSFYLGVMTDPAYHAVYKAIATGKYLTLKEDVYIEAAGKKLPLFEATEEGKKLFKCEKNRCTVEVCSMTFDGFSGIVNKGRFANVIYKVKTTCSGDIYNIFKPLADRQYIKEEVIQENANFELGNEGWKIK